MSEEQLSQEVQRRQLVESVYKSLKKSASGPIVTTTFLSGLPFDLSIFHEVAEERLIEKQYCEGRADLYFAFDGALRHIHVCNVPSSYTQEELASWITLEREGRAQVLEELGLR